MTVIKASIPKKAMAMINMEKLTITIKNTR
jgi:hypothetical protein